MKCNICLTKFKGRLKTKDLSIQNMRKSGLSLKKLNPAFPALGIICHNTRQTFIKGKCFNFPFYFFCE